jgi:endoglucanase
LPFNQYANGPYKVQGNAILGKDGNRYLFHGVGRDGLEFSCPYSGYFDTQHLIYMGPPTSGPPGTFWYSNTVRLPLSEGFWLNGFSAVNCTAAQYQISVKSTIDFIINSMKLNVIIDLQWNDAGCQTCGGGAGWQMPDNDSVTFWKQIASLYANSPNVLFELFNEPHPTDSQGKEWWACWQQGCQITNDTSYETYCQCTETKSYQGVGMQALVNAVRSTGANNIVFVAGLNWGFDLSQLGSFPITGTNVAYDSHPYPYGGKMPPNWDAAFGNLSATAPVVSLENGQYDCGKNPDGTVDNYMLQLLDYFDAHLIGWTAWAWYADQGNAGCGWPQLISDYLGTPLPLMGTWIYERLLSYANSTPPTPGPSPSPSASPSPSPTPTPPPQTNGPVSKLWYFGEGRVGAGFTEWLTLGNPTGTDCQANVQYFYTPDGGSPHSKSLPVSVPKYTRVTQLVNKDLGISATGGGNSVSATVDVGTSCPGIVAERPIYNTTFGNPLGVNSGTDVIGATHTGTSFYFADVRTGNQNGGKVSSFIPILNNGTTTANVTATYFVGGKQVGQQTTQVPPGTRGTIYPNNAGLPAHVAAQVTSDQPVLIERPSYFNHVSEGNAGTVSGEADVVGVQQPSNDFLFAEGYTGGSFQEYLVLANFGTSAISGGTLLLEYTTGATYSFPVTIAAEDQTTFDINQLTGNPASHGGACTTSSTTCVTSQDVSIEVQAGAGFVAEREMFFHYNHNASYGRSLSTQGVSDVIGQVGPASASAYSFAEGYTNAGYDEWLTIQNPTGSAETITITLANAKGTVYPFSVNVSAHSRYTVDIVATVMQHLYHSGDGYAGYEVSMALQSSSGPFVAERPMYWNASGTQGGDDVIGYAGG